MDTTSLHCTAHNWKPTCNYLHVKAFLSIHQMLLSISQVLHCLSPPAVDRAGGGAGGWRVREVVRAMNDPGRALELMSSARVQGEWSGYVHTQCRGRECTFSALFGNFPLSGCPAVVIEKWKCLCQKVQSTVNCV